MPRIPNRIVREALIGAGVAGSILLLAPVGGVFVLESVQRLEGNHYPGTAQQAGVVYLQLYGHRVASALEQCHLQQGKWPASLSEAVEGGFLPKEWLRYPKSDALPDRRDILKMKEFEEWIYIPPREGAPELPLVVAPRPFTSSMGRLLPKPRRIIVNRETFPDTVDEEKIAPLLNGLTGR